MTAFRKPDEKEYRRSPAPPVAPVDPWNDAGGAPLSPPRDPMLGDLGTTVLADDRAVAGDDSRRMDFAPPTIVSDKRPPVPSAFVANVPTEEPAKPAAASVAEMLAAVQARKSPGGGDGPTPPPTGNPLNLSWIARAGENLRVAGSQIKPDYSAANALNEAANRPALEAKAAAARADDERRKMLEWKFQHPEKPALTQDQLGQKLNAELGVLGAKKAALEQRKPALTPEQLAAEHDAKMKLIGARTGAASRANAGGATSNRPPDAGGGPLDESSVSPGAWRAGEYLHTTGNLPTGIARDRALVNAAFAVDAELTRREREAGGTPKGLADARAGFRAQESALRSGENVAIKTEMNEEAARGAMKLVKAASDAVDRSDWPLFNKWVVMPWREATGDSKVIALKTATQTLANEYARIMQGMAGVTSDSARNHAYDLMNHYMSRGNIDAALDLFDQEFKTRTVGNEKAMADLRARINGSPPRAVSGDAVKYTGKPVPAGFTPITTDGGQTWRAVPDANVMAALAKNPTWARGE